MNIKKIIRKLHHFKKNIVFSIVIGFFIILIGLAIMLFMNSANNKKLQENVFFEEKPLTVEVLKIQAQDYRVKLKGYGVVKPTSLLSLASEVNGMVIFVHPNLKSGKVIPPGETLFKIDDLNYRVKFCMAKLVVEQLINLIGKIEQEDKIDSIRIKKLTKNKDIAYNQFKQKRELFEKHNIGTQFDVDSFEKSYNLACDSLEIMKKTLLIYPIQIKEAKIKLESAEANLILAKANLDKCKIKSPFFCRVKSSLVEVGEFVSLGQNIAVLADDSTLEIEVSIDSNDVIQWIQFESNALNKAWFGKPKYVDCEIIWGKDNYIHKWVGKLDRISGSDQNLHTIRVVIQIDTASISKSETLLPLIEGMFCTINIPGRLMKNVYRIPRQSVSFDNEVYICDENNRLKTVKVNIIRSEGKYVFVDEGLNQSELIIKTRLVNPLTGILLNSILQEAED